MGDLDASQLCTIKKEEVGVPVSPGTEPPGELVERCDSEKAAEAGIARAANKEG